MKASWMVPCAAALLLALAPSVRADGRAEKKSPKRALSRFQDEKKGEAKGKGEEKAEINEKGFAHKDYANSHLDLGYYTPCCDYPWCRYGQYERLREAPHPTLEFYCPPVSTKLNYPELYPSARHAGGAVINTYPCPDLTRGHVHTYPEEEEEGKGELKGGKG